MSSSAIIVNEKANWGAGRHKVRQATDFLHRQGFAFSVSTAAYGGHAKELAAAAAAQGIDTVIVIGGDGTLNEVTNGLMESGQGRLPHLGIVPAGSSNDFSKSLGIPQDVEEACRTVMGGRVREVDVGQAKKRGHSTFSPAGSPDDRVEKVECPFFFCSASCLGYFAEVAARSLEMKRWRGSLRYIVPAFGVIREMTGGWEMSIKADGRTFQGDYAVLLVGNAPRFGGLTMLPGARPDDGVLDCLLIEMAGKWEALRLIPLVYRQALERHKRVVRFQTTSLAVRLGRSSRLCNDGEMCPGGVETIEYRVLPRRLHVFC